MRFYYWEDILIPGTLDPKLELMMMEEALSIVLKL
jgi:hypothetical protein